MTRLGMGKEKEVFVGISIPYTARQSLFEKSRNAIFQCVFVTVSRQRCVCMCVCGSGSVFRGYISRFPAGKLRGAGKLHGLKCLIWYWDYGCSKNTILKFSQWLLPHFYFCELFKIIPFDLCSLLWMVLSVIFVQFILVLKRDKFKGMRQMNKEYSL